MEKVWKVLDKVSDDLREQLLYNRGLKSQKKRKQFFNPKIADFETEIKIPGIKLAWKRIEKAIKEGEQIVVYGDYDVDGVCASAILYKALLSLNAKILPYIPHREKEGYGLSKQGLENVRDMGATLVITVDNGIVAIEQAKFAKEIGIDLIITDHHVPLDSLPEAYVIVHSTKMCGAAVAWCLVRDVVTGGLRDELLEFVAVATVADMLPLLGIGRAFVYEGLMVLNKTKNLGFQQLIHDAGINLGTLGSYEIGHMIAPRINAIGRLEHAIDALRLLCTNNPANARRLAVVLTEANSQRQKLTVDAVEEARVLISKNGTKKIHILDSKKWSAGIIGLVAARIMEEQFRPTIALSVGEKFAKGSARSVKGLNIVELIRQCSDLLVDVGGHAGAAGFTIANENIEEFKQKLEKVMEEKMSEGENVQVLEIEAEIEAKDLKKSLVRELDEFEPFGFGNPKPLLMSRNMKISDLRTLSEGKHLKFKAEGIDSIAFGVGDKIAFLEDGKLVDLAYFLEINKFNGSENLQLKIKDIRWN